MRAFGYTPELGASSTDSNIAISLGVPAVTIGSGGTGGRARIDEWIDVAKPRRGAAWASALAPAAPLPSLPQQPSGVAWPTDAWPQGHLPAHLDQTRFAGLIDAAFSAPSTELLGETHAVVIVQGGRLVHERYNDGFGPDATYPSWSKAKSITQALVGIAVGDGKLDIQAPADVPEWTAPSDPRAAITLDQLLRMSSGLKWIEEYSPDQPSDVIAMLFGEGKDDVAAYATNVALAHKPNSVWSYSSGTTNIVVRALSRAIAAVGPDFEAFMRERLFAPIGMTSPIPKFDAAGTFIGSSISASPAPAISPVSGCSISVMACGRVAACCRRAGLTTPARRPSSSPAPTSARRIWRLQWWLDIAGPGSFSANGYDGQFTVCVPDLDLILVRHGASEAQKLAVKAWIADVIDCFRP